MGFGSLPGCEWPGGVPLIVYWAASHETANGLRYAETRIRCADDPAVLGPNCGDEPAGVPARPLDAAHRADDQGREARSRCGRRCRAGCFRRTSACSRARSPSATALWLDPRAVRRLARADADGAGAHVRRGVVGHPPRPYVARPRPRRPRRPDARERPRAAADLDLASLSRGRRARAARRGPAVAGDRAAARRELPDLLAQLLQQHADPVVRRAHDAVGLGQRLTRRQRAAGRRATRRSRPARPRRRKLLEAALLDQLRLAAGQLENPLVGIGGLVDGLRRADADAPAAIPPLTTSPSATPPSAIWVNASASSRSSSASRSIASGSRAMQAWTSSRLWKR